MLAPRRHPLVHRFRPVLLTILLGSIVLEMAWAGDPSTSKHLWHTVTTPPPLMAPPVSKKPWNLREREIELDLALLHVLKDAGARPLPRITIELFDHANPELDVSSTVSRINDTAVLRGTFKPPVHGDFTFAITGNLLIGTMHMGNRLYKTEHIGNGRLRLLEIDPDRMPPD